MGFLGLLLIFWGGIVVCAARLLAAKSSQRKEKLGFYPSGALIGNALHALQANCGARVSMLSKRSSTSLRMRRTKQDRKTQRQHLMRQARRIRSGKPIDRLTTFILHVTNVN